jgi:lysophospholipase L1-like esterase
MPSAKKMREFEKLVIGLLLVGLLSSFWSVFSTPPHDSLDSIHPGSPRPLVLALGDELTHGVSSHNWMLALKQAHPGVKLVNLARSFSTSHTVLTAARALELPKQPELAIVFAGTHDALAALSPSARAWYVKWRLMPADAPTELHGALDAYAHNLAATIAHLRSPAVGARRVVVVSPPPFGSARDAAEPPTASYWGALAAQPNAVVAEVATRAALTAKQHGCAYVDLHAALAARMASEPPPPPRAEHLTFTPSFARLFAHLPFTFLTQYLGIGWDELSFAPFTHDLVRLNSRGAAVVLELVEPVVAEVEVPARWRRQAGEPPLAAPATRLAWMWSNLNVQEALTESVFGEGRSRADGGDAAAARAGS